MDLQLNDVLTNGNQTLTVKKITGLDEFIFVEFAEYPGEFFNTGNLKLDNWSVVHGNH